MHTMTCAWRPDDRLRGHLHRRAVKWTGVQMVDNAKWDCDKKRVDWPYFAQIARRSPPTRLNSYSLFVTRHKPLERA